ncbi:hypothetical protein OsI_04359 [Oryza sativa Indica Group]|uniref:Uncharacterized protein n=1 Tax=Oryza sativa subsp. indica TaxID=39946 RepID=A2WWT0_ORYSI|nr:hypothetical protein OsI_04359 [Oryza sativa Indica Group]
MAVAEVKMAALGDGGSGAARREKKRERVRWQALGGGAGQAEPGRHYADTARTRAGGGGARAFITVHDAHTQDLSSALSRH